MLAPPAAQVALAFPLSYVLEEELSRTLEDFRPRVAAVTGVSSMSENSRERALDDFRTSKIHVLVATEALQEVCSASLSLRRSEAEALLCFLSS